MKKWSLLSLVLLTCLFSCQLQKVTLKVYSPPRLFLPPEVKMFLVTSRYVPATGPYEDMQWGAYESVDSLKWSFSESVVDTLAKRMISENYFLVKARHYPRMLRNNNASMPLPLPWEGMLDLAQKEYVQAILVIEGFDVQRNPAEVTDMGGDFEARQTVDVTLAIRIYEPEKMRMIDDSVYTFTSEFLGRGKSRTEAESKLPSENTEILEACSQAADAYYELILPGEVSETRSFFTDSDSSMTVAAAAAKEGKWGRAESKWKWLAYNAKDTVVQAKASYNMALICERDGRINQAVGFARRSQRIRPDKHTENYIAILDKKISDYAEQANQKKLIKRW